MFIFSSDQTIFILYMFMCNWFILYIVVFYMLFCSIFYFFYYAILLLPRLLLLPYCLIALFLFIVKKCLQIFSRFFLVLLLFCRKSAYFFSRNFLILRLFCWKMPQIFFQKFFDIAPILSIFCYIYIIIVQKMPRNYLENSRAPFASAAEKRPFF